MKGFLILLAVILGVLAVTVWPTRFRYDRMNGCLLRMDRLSGESRVLIAGYGWSKVSDVDPFQMLPKAVVVRREKEDEQAAAMQTLEMVWAERKEWADVHRLLVRAEARLASSTTLAKSDMETADVIYKRHLGRGDWMSVSLLIEEADLDVGSQFGNSRAPLSSARAISARNASSQ